MYCRAMGDLGLRYQIIGESRMHDYVGEEILTDIWALSILVGKSPQTIEARKIHAP